MSLVYVGSPGYSLLLAPSQKRMPFGEPRCEKWQLDIIRCICGPSRLVRLTMDSLDAWACVFLSLL